MKFAISKSYIVPAILLNPVIFLMSLNTVLSYMLPPVAVDPAKGTPPYPTFGSSAQNPQLDIHASEKLCWSYTCLIVCAQLAAFGMVSECREAGKVNARIKGDQDRAKSGACNETGKAVYRIGIVQAKGAVELGLKVPKHENPNRGILKRAMRILLEPAIRRQYFAILQRLSSTAWRPGMQKTKGRSGSSS